MELLDDGTRSMLQGLSRSRRDRTMSMARTRPAIGFYVLVILLVLGTGWIVERAIGGFQPPSGAEIPGSHSDGGTETGELAKPNDAVRPAATDQEYDRSDLLLSQG
jgi:hypothetical protein